MPPSSRPRQVATINKNKQISPLSFAASDLRAEVDGGAGFSRIIFAYVTLQRKECGGEVWKNRPSCTVGFGSLTNLASGGRFFNDKRASYAECVQYSYVALMISNMPIQPTDDVYGKLAISSHPSDIRHFYGRGDV